MVRIGIIDSGINDILRESYSNIQGIGLQKTKYGNQIEYCEDFSDRIGHGNECFRIISGSILKASYYIVKIFERELVSDLDILTEAVSHCIKQDVDIINISAGVVCTDIPIQLKEVCDIAFDMNITIMSAQHNKGYRCYPACYDKVVSVGAIDLNIGEMYRYVQNNTIEFFTSVVDLQIENKNWGKETSFACARMTAYAANIINEKGKINSSQMRLELMKNGSKLIDLCTN